MQRKTAKQGYLTGEALNELKRAMAQDEGHQGLSISCFFPPTLPHISTADGQMEGKRTQQ